MKPEELMELTKDGIGGPSFRGKTWTFGPETDVTLTEAATLLGVQPATLRQQIARGALRAEKRGRDWFVTAREVERYRKEHKR